MQNYDIRYDDKYGQLAQIDVAAEGAKPEAMTRLRPIA